MSAMQKSLMEQARQMMGGEISGDMLDLLVIQLRGAMQMAKDAPEDVLTTGKAFIESLDRWSESKKSGVK